MSVAFPCGIPHAIIRGMAKLMNQPTVSELNDIQRQWMALDYLDSPQHKAKVFKLMESYPKTYVSGHDGLGVCIYQGSPLTVNVPFAEALKLCSDYHGRTDVAWNGKTGEWYAL